jgi:hypothetical protein
MATRRAAAEMTPRDTGPDEFAAGECVPVSVRRRSIRAVRLTDGGQRGSVAGRNVRQQTLERLQHVVASREEALLSEQRGHRDVASAGEAGEIEQLGERARVASVEVRREVRRLAARARACRSASA